jgi:hypothetical protein
MNVQLATMMRKMTTIFIVGLISVPAKTSSSQKSVVELHLPKNPLASQKISTMAD